MPKLKTVTAFVFTLVTVFSFFISCKEDYNRNKSHANIPGSSIEEGERLAKKYCQSCHLLPDPAMLDANTWEEGALPAMGPMLGIFKHRYQTYPSGKRDSNLDSNFYPAKPLLTPDEWQHIINYYSAVSPDSLVLPAQAAAVTPGLEGFQLVPSEFKVPSPTSSYLKIDTATHQLLMTDLFTHHLYRFDKNLQLLDSVNTNAAIVDVEFSKDKMLFCNIGDINPNNKKLGTGNFINISKGGKLETDTTPLLATLARPVQISAADFNKDGITDYLVCEFGFMQGSLSVFTGKGDTGFTKQVLRFIPGAEKAYIQDYNKDGLPDIWVLFAQGDEGIFLFTNKGNGKFDQQQVLRFPSVYGSTFFELVDFNKDGYQDVIYTCGDNADYSQVLKPYHGIYIYLNDGKNNFTQQFFYHMNGCYKALARDYDNDGDLDIAAISFFADYSKNQDEGFLYLKNEGGNSFKPYSLPESRTGRWLTMDAGDLDGDGKIDLVLGNFSYGPVMMQPKVDWVKGSSFLFLKNMWK
jgi:FG-GAP-like repeat